MRPAAGNIEGRWYAANTREPIRDETLREGLVRLGAVQERQGLPTTSPRPRHALVADFAALFRPDLLDEALQAQIARWQEANLSPGALARIAIIRRGAVAREGRVLVTFPNGETRDMEPGPSSVISKAVVEEFAARFLEQPGVIWLSESRNQVVARDDQLAQAIGLAMEAGFREHQVAFVTAYADRDDGAFKGSVSELAWQSFAWFASEPEHIMVLHRGADADRALLSELMRG